MKPKKLPEKIPVNGFIKLSKDKLDFKNSEERVALIRKGNELYNQNNYEMAKRIFITTGYTDGLIRLGDYYWKKKDPLEAFRMYWLAPSKKKVESMLEKMTGIIKFWLQDKEKGKEKNV